MHHTLRPYWTASNAKRNFQIFSAVHVVRFLESMVMCG